jgi:hypothetical protein
MKNQPHMHIFRGYAVWYGPQTSARAGARKGYPRRHGHCWMAAPVAAGQCRDAAVAISGLSGACGDTARKIRPGFWEVEYISRVSVGEGGRLRPSRREKMMVYAPNRQSALVIAEIERRYDAQRSIGHYAAPRLTERDGRTVVVRKDRATKQWLVVEAPGRPRKGGR